MQAFKPAVSALRVLVRPSVSLQPRFVGAKAATEDSQPSADYYKRDIVAQVSASLNVKPADVDKVVSATLEAITNAVAEDKKVQLTGFGTFKRTESKARDGRNPSTGKPLKIEASARPSFTAGKSFKDKVKASYKGPN